MPYHDYYEGEGLEKYLKYFEVYSDGKHKSQQIVDSLKRLMENFLFVYYPISMIYKI